MPLSPTASSALTRAKTASCVVSETAPIGIAPDLERPDHTYPLPAGAIVLFFTDGLIEHPDHAIDNRLTALADLATAHADLPLKDFVQALADHHPSDGHDDMAVLALRVPAVG